MNFQKALKPLRVLVGVVTLSLFVWAFSDFTHRVPQELFSALTWAQFVPSLLQSVWIVLGVATGGFVLVILLTLLFGRVYCSWICPLGIFNDVFYYIGKKLRPKRKKMRYTLSNDWFRYSLLFLVVVTVVFFGINIFLSLLDPYSIFGRFAADFGKPAYLYINNGLHRVSQGILPGMFHLENIKSIPWEALLIPGVFLGLIAGMSFFRGRLYCNTICPVGTLLGALSHLSLFRIGFNRSGCTRCGECMFACKSQCIDIKNLKVDFSRCVGCFNCIDACKNNSMGYQWFRKKQKEKPRMQPVQDSGPDHSKRKFIAGALLALPLVSATLRKTQAQGGSSGLQGGTGNASSGVENPAEGIDTAVAEYKSGRNPVAKENAVMPPGAVSFQHFSAACTACHLCVSACPTGVLRPSFLEFGWLHMLKPHMDYDASFCNFACTTCSDVCPTGALVKFSPPEAKMTAQIGIAEFHPNNCIVETEHTACGACAEHCPTQAVHMVPFHIPGLTIPKVEPDLCVGCGACEYACPTRPYRAIFVNGLIQHQVARSPVGEKVDDLIREDFPF